MRIGTIQSRQEDQGERAIALRHQKRGCSVYAISRGVDRERQGCAQGWIGNIARFQAHIFIGKTNFSISLYRYSGLPLLFVSLILTRIIPLVPLLPSSRKAVACCTDRMVRFTPAYITV